MSKQFKPVTAEARPPLAIQTPVAAEQPRMQSLSEVLPDRPVEPTGPRMFEVYLNANTPLEFNPLTVEALHEGEAWQKFCDANGISDSTCPRTIKAV